MVWRAYGKVKKNRGSPGIDRVCFEQFEQNLEGNLYKLWNRLTSGSYFPPALREVELPKANGKVRKLGIPTLADRIAQQVVKTYLAPRLESEFHDSSYGYRPLKSAHRAIEAVKRHVGNYAWVVDMAIKSFFDELDHVLMLKALDRHVEEKWVKMYVSRWLEVPVETKQGERVPKQGKGTPQGGVISPLLANLYLHYALDVWLSKRYPLVSFVRYADDVIVHCASESQCREVYASIKERLQTCHLRLNEGKTKIVYCQYYRRSKKDFPKKFDFLGFSFKPVSRRSNSGKGFFLGFSCEMSIGTRKRLAEDLKGTKFHKWTPSRIEDIANLLNPRLRGWVNYYGKVHKASLSKVFRLLHHRMAKWVLNKYKAMNSSYAQAYTYLKRLRRSQPTLFYHWSQGYRI